MFSMKNVHIQEGGMFAQWAHKAGQVDRILGGQDGECFSVLGQADPKEISESSLQLWFCAESLPAFAWRQPSGFGSSGLVPRAEKPVLT